MQLKLHHKDVTDYVDTLLTLKKSALPNAVRSTLTDMAIATKRTLPKSAKATFITRNKSFVRSHTAWNKAKGWDIRKMQSEVGFLNEGRKTKVAEGMEAQEYGGRLKTRKTLHHDKGRISGNNLRKTRSKYRYERDFFEEKSEVQRPMTNIRASKRRKSRFAAKAITAHKRGKLLKTRGRQRKFVYYQVHKWRKPSENKIKFRMTPVLVTSKGVYGIKKTGFSKRAALLATKKTNDMFIKNANFWINKSIKK